ncbi:universal stress protein PHOS32 [Nymphaea colorata]|nr:universal stress protein PHOS32 [Nymphaea colorata]
MDHGGGSGSGGGISADERRVGVALDFSPCSRLAVKWAVENMARHGDHLILVNVQSTSTVHYEEGETQLWEATGSPFIPLGELSDPHITKKYGIKPDAETLDLLNCLVKQKEVMVVMKIYWGDAREKICEAINDIPLSCLVIGSRGLGTLRRALMGSVSNYVVNHATCPVTVVKQGEGED